MAYQRKTKSTKIRGGQGVFRQTTHRNSNGKLTLSNSRSNGAGVTTTTNSKGEVWQTITNAGWTTKRKIVGLQTKPTPRPRKSRRKKTDVAAGNGLSPKVVLLFGILGLLAYFYIKK